MKTTLLIILILVLFVTTQFQRETIENLKAIDASRPDVSLGKENKSGDVYIRITKGPQTHYFKFDRVCTPVRTT